MRGAGVKPKTLYALKRYERNSQAWRGGILTRIPLVASLCVTACCPCRGAGRVVPKFRSAGRRIRWRVPALTPKTPGPVASADYKQKSLVAE